MSDSTSSQSSAFAKIYDSLILSRPWLILFLLTIVTATAGFYAQNYKVDASADALVLEGDEDLAFFREVSKRYAAEEFFIVAYQPKDYLFSESVLKNLSELVADLQQLEGVSTVMSVLDAPLLYSPKVSIASLIAGVKTLRDKSVNKNLAAEEFRNSPIYKQLLTSTDAKTTALQVGLVRDNTYNRLLDERDGLRVLAAAGELSAENADKLVLAEKTFKDYTVQSVERQQQLVKNVRAVLDRHRGAATEIFLGGVPMIASDMVSFVKSDMQVFGIGILLFVIVVLTIIFRALRWVFLPLLVCMLTNIFMLGLLGFLDWRMTVISSNFIALLLIITLAIAVHLIVRYREIQLTQPQATQRELALATVLAMLRPCLYTGLTTIVAFMSLVISGIRPVMDFGWMMTVGVVVALLTTFIVVPVGMLLGQAPKPENKTQALTDESVFTLRFAYITENYGGIILAVAALILLFSVSGVSQLKVENRFIDYFDESTEIYRGMELVDSELGGTIPLEIVVYPAQKNNTDQYEDDSFDEFDDEFGDDFGSESSEISPWFTVSGLNELERIHQHIDGLAETGKVLSLATVYQLADDLLDGGLDDIQLALAYRNLPTEIKEVMVTPYLHD